MVVISNSSPIIHLAKIGRLSLLERLYSRILVPEKVYLECTDTVHYHKEVGLIAAQSAWIKRYLINSFAEDLQKLQRSGFWLSQNLVNTLLSSSGSNG
jgi:uncharacterized protein